MEDLIMLALSEYGIKEIAGNNDNPEIMKYFWEIGHKWVKHDEEAWCAAFINWCLKKTGYEYTGKLNARSFLSLGEPVLFPEVGNIVIFWRGAKTSPLGHVGIFIANRDGLIYTLSGNQSNMVNITGYPENQLLGYRKLKKVK